MGCAACRARPPCIKEARDPRFRRIVALTSEKAQLDAERLGSERRLREAEARSARLQQERELRDKQIAFLQQARHHRPAPTDGEIPIQPPSRTPASPVCCLQELAEKSEALLQAHRDYSSQALELRGRLSGLEESERSLQRELRESRAAREDLEAQMRDSAEASASRAS